MSATKVPSASFFRCAAAALLAAGALTGASAPAAAQSQVTVYPPPRLDRGPPPDFQTYPLWQRIFGFGGAIYPDYVSPSTGRDGGNKLAYWTGTGPGNVVFATGTTDRVCQMTEAPTITVLDPPAGGTLSWRLGYFTAQRTDAGSHFCRGRTVEGWLVSYKGRPPRGGTTATIRVAYPPLGRSYTHVVSIPGR